MTTSEREAKLVRKAAACSNEAFERLMDGHRPSLRMTISKYVSNREDRSDVEGDLVEKLLEDRKRRLRLWDPIAPFAAYLCTITVRHCLDWLRRASSLMGRELPALGPSSPERDPGEVISELVSAPSEEAPEGRALLKETQSIVRAAMDDLPDRDRMVLSLRFTHGLNGPAIARTLGLTQTATNVAVFRALRRLERKLVDTAPGIWA